MARIETQEGAARLAHSIANDIRLYSGEKLSRGEDMGDVFEEARTLFRQRVLPELYPVLEAALAELSISGRVTTTTRPPRRLPALGELLLGVLLVVSALGWWLTSR